MNPLRTLARSASRRARARRADLFRRLFALDEGTKVLDLGSEDGSNIHSVLEGTPVRPGNVYLADIDPDAVAEGQRRYGYNPVVIHESKPLPYPDGFFDVVYCSSVIEHVTVPKEQTWEIRDQARFVALSRQRQAEFAREVMRVGRQYFVQTPDRYFPIESHTWLPFVAVLPRPAQLEVIRFTNRFWVKETLPGWHLLTGAEMRRLFPEAVILRERVWGLTKSLMAVRSATWTGDGAVARG